MHVALIVDEERLLHEQAALNRLSIGLIGEGVQVTRIVPAEIAARPLAAGEKRVALAARIGSRMRVLPWMRRERAARVAEAMEKGLPDLLYAVGVAAWRLGLDLARALDRPVAIDVARPDQIRRAPRGRGAARVAGFVTPTRVLANALRERVGADLVCHVPMGVAIPAHPRSVLANPERSIAIAILGGGRDVASYRSMLAGLSRVTKQMPQIQAFLELAGPNEHEIWRHARRLELLETVTAMTGAAQHRALLTYCDMILMPEQYGNLRSLMLEAMTHGIPILASEDPFLEMLVDEETALIVPSNAESWARAIGRVVTEPETGRALGLAGRAKMAAEHRSSDQVARLMRVFEQMIRGGPIPFDGTVMGEAPA